MSSKGHIPSIGALPDELFQWKSLNDVVSLEVLINKPKTSKYIGCMKYILNVFI